MYLWKWSYSSMNESFHYQAANRLEVLDIVGTLFLRLLTVRISIQPAPWTTLGATSGRPRLYSAHLR